MARWDDEERDDDLDISLPRRRGYEEIPNYLVFSILMFFCCWPFAIAAVVNAAKVNTLQAQGDYEGARRASEKAKTFAITALILGLIIQSINCIVQISLLNQERAFR